jgi:hypothetical protein
MDELREYLERGEDSGVNNGFISGKPSSVHIAISLRDRLVSYRLVQGKAFVFARSCEWLDASFVLCRRHQRTLKLVVWRGRQHRQAGR